MSWNPEAITAMSIAIAALITAIFTGIVNILQTLRSERKVDVLGTKADQIAHQTNGASTVDRIKIEKLQKEVMLLQQFIAEQRQTAALLVQTLIASKIPMAPVMPAHPPLSSKEEMDTPV